MDLQKYNVTGMSCAACQARVEKAVNKVPGVTSVAVSLLTGSMGVEGEADPSAVIRAVENAGYGATLSGSGAKAGPNGFATDAAAKTGKDAQGTGADAKAGKDAHAEGAEPDRSRSQANAAAARARIAEQEAMLEDRETPRLRRRLIASVAVLLLLMYGSMGHMMWGWPLPGFFEENHIAMGIAQMILAAVIMMINGQFFTSGFRSLLHLAPNMDTLVAMGSMASFVWSVVILFKMTADQLAGNADAVMEDMHSFYFESAAMIVTLITIGKMLEAMSKGRSTDALKGLLQMSPRTALIEGPDGQEQEIPIEQLAAGDVFLVRPGESIPVDGEIIEGTTAVNEAALTGESIPVDKGPGDGISAATVNTSGFVKARATRVGEDTTLAQIIQLVSDAAATKAPIAKIADRVSGIFVPVVIGIAVCVVLIWLLTGADVGYALARGISVLVISCPCALGLATPVAIMVGSGVGSRNGILFKTAASLESAGRTEVIALDKTGTITRGEPVVTDLLPAEGVTEEEFLRYAALLEARSEHPIARAILERARRDGLDPAATASAGTESAGTDEGMEVSAPSCGCEPLQIEEFEVLPGNGLRGKLKGQELAGGSLTFMGLTSEEDPGSEGPVTGAVSTERLREDISVTGAVPTEPLHEEISASDAQKALVQTAAALAEEGRTPMAFSLEGRLLGVIAVADTIKEDSPQAIRQMKDMGIHVVMLTGDNEKTARAIGRQAGVDEIIAGVKPDGKEAVIRKLSEGGKVAMVGDGINDAPALVRADTGIAIGAGADVAIDAADVVLMNNRLSDAAAAIRLSRMTIRNIHENLFWAFIYNILLIPLAAGAYVHLMHGWSMSPMLGAAAMSLSSFCVCMNALRLNRKNIYGSGSAGRSPERLSGKPEASEKVQENPGNVSNASDNQKTKETESTTMKKTMKIEGMMCPHCEATVKKALEALEEVSEATVSHEANTAIVELASDVADEVLTKAVEDKDYTVLTIE